MGVPLPNTGLSIWSRILVSQHQSLRHSHHQLAGQKRAPNEITGTTYRAKDKTIQIIFDYFNQ